MGIVLFLISYVLLDIAGSVFYLAVLLFSFWLMKKLFNMNENKWNALFNFGKGLGFYFIIIFPYLFMLVVLFLVSKAWFEFIHIKYSVLGSLSVVLLLALLMIIAFPKLKNIVDHEIRKNR